MFGWHNLKRKINTSPKVECPVKDCDVEVDRQPTRHLQRKPEFRCAKHRIFISPSTFEYENEADNFLWRDEDDEQLLANVKNVKTEKYRLGRERSEDAVTWNVIRFIDKHGELSGLLDSVLCPGIWNNARLVYWSYDPLHEDVWEWLLRARVEFGEADDIHGAQGQGVSEPDLIVTSDDAVVFIEAKFYSDNRTSGYGKTLKRRLANPKKYTTGDKEWYGNVFRKDYRAVVNDQKYELLRFWLLGSWIASKQKKRFYLINLVRDGKESEIEKAFGVHIRQCDERSFIRVTWERLHGHLVSHALSNATKDRLLARSAHRPTRQSATSRSLISGACSLFCSIHAPRCSSAAI